MNCKIINIGNELVEGFIVNTNAQFLAFNLRKLGFLVEKIVEIPDNYFYIKNEISESLGKFNLIFTTGGLGPTSDDITKNVLLEVFGGEFVEDKNVLNDISTFLTNKELIQYNISQAYVPSSATVIRNFWGTAPALMFEKNNTTLIALPGIPYEMKKIFETHIKGFLVKEFHAKELPSKILNFYGIPEAVLSEKLKDFEKKLPETIKIAYLPSPSVLKIRLFSNNCSNDSVVNFINDLSNELVDTFKDYFFGYDNDNLEDVLGKILKNSNSTICTAESCTGGYIAHKITSVAGASQYFKGSIVAYDNEIKTNILKIPPEIIQQYGAVSEITVKLMAENSLKLLNTDYSIAISGIAGPTGGTPTKPVGTAYIAIASKNSVLTKKITGIHLREINIQLFAANAMFFFIKNYESL